MTKAGRDQHISETRVTPWAPFDHRGLTHYRIWQRKTEFGMYQRHQWRRADDITLTLFEDWIPSTKEWCPNAEPIANEEPSR